MSIQILATKLFIPRLRPKVVDRPRLIQQLNDGLQNMHGVTLISAPAGYGKTTLVSEWIKGNNIPAAWLSLDAEDSDPIRFIVYLVAAIQTIKPKIGAPLLEALQSSQLPAIELCLTTLINQITTDPDNIILVLDDYHLIDSTLVDNALGFLIEHLPRQIHLVITSREDPNVPLTRLRVHNQLTEIRVSDLRFSAAEVAEFLNKSMDLNLSTEYISTLEDRTEGWIAGLQLAALSMQGHQDVPGFIQEFDGDHRYVVDYLVEEVLRRQSPEIHNFLLQTSILERLNGALCDAVTGQSGGIKQLEILQQGNYFLIPLDDKRQWYRYHHLFADVLHLHLMTEQQNLVSILHIRASEWFDKNGYEIDAIRHMLVAKEFDRASELIERAVPELRKSRQEALVLSWLKQLPDELVKCRPVLSVYYAGASLTCGEPEGVEARLQDAEVWLEKMSNGINQPLSANYGCDKVENEEIQRLPGWISIFRAASGLALGDLQKTIEYASRALEHLPEEDYLGYGAAAGLLGLAYWTNGDLEAAYKIYEEGMRNILKAGYITDSIGGAIALADILNIQGRLREATKTYERGLLLAKTQGDHVPKGTGDMFVGMSEQLLEQNDLITSKQFLSKCKELGELSGLPQNRYRWRLATARIYEAEGELKDALDLYQEAEQLYSSDLFPNGRPIAAQKTRLLIKLGRLDEAFDWVKQQRLSIEDDLTYIHEFEHITLARVLFAQSKIEHKIDSMSDVIRFLERLFKNAEKGGRYGSAIEILLLQALAYQEMGDIPAALFSLEQSLSLAEPEGYIRIFIGEGNSLKQLLTEAASQSKHQKYIMKILEEYNKKLNDKTVVTPRPSTNPEKQLSSEILVESLSRRELEILELIAKGLSNREISERLFLALNTIKGHNQKIFDKLQVQSRTEAIARAHELGLL